MYGGGLYSEQSYVNLSDVVFQNNFGIGTDNDAGAGGNAVGGAAAFISSSPFGVPVTMNNVSFTGNALAAGSGEREVERTIKSGLEAGLAHPRASGSGR